MAETSEAERLAGAAEALVKAIQFDDSGESGRGGNGGLISRETIRKSDEARIALARYRRGTADESSMLQDDLRQLLQLLGLPDGARPQSPHKVFQECLTVLRERLSDSSPKPTGAIARYRRRGRSK